MKSTQILFLFCLLVVNSSFGFPDAAYSDRKSFLVKPNKNIQNDAPTEKEEVTPRHDDSPKINEMRIDSNITNRFAHTLVTSKVKHPATKAQETIFSIVLPKKAFITKFVMSIDGKDYEAYIQEKEQAKATYEQAVSSGQGAGLVASSARESNSFTVSVNVEPQSKVIFYLTYEQLLERKDNQYELVVNIHPKQPVKDLTVYVNISESLPLTFVKAPSIRSGNEISKIEGDLDPRAHISQTDPNSAIVKFSPSFERQKEFAKMLGTDEAEGLAGQFVIQYDVQRNPNGGEILLQDGYFVHFFAPSNLKPLPKYVVFVLDTSSSMYGNKIDQLKMAMKSILGELKDQDKFHLIDFNSAVKVLDLYDSSGSVEYGRYSRRYFGRVNEHDTNDLMVKTFPASYSVNPDNIEKAKEAVNAMHATAATNIEDALQVALRLVEIDRKSRNVSDENTVQPMIIFLTDGEATVGESNPDKILSQVQERNAYSVPIFSLSFGYGADRALLQKLSLRNSGFSRHIYESSDASLQMEDFYKQISSPLLSDVTFKYVEEAKDLSNTAFPNLFNGSELIVVGRLSTKTEFDQLPAVRCNGINGPVELTPTVKESESPLERLWAYLTIQQLLDKMENTDNKTAYKQKALDLALKYSFVTAVSSLVVVKPNSTNSAVEPIAADKGLKAPTFVNHYSRTAGLGMPGPPAPASYYPLSRSSSYGVFATRSFIRPPPLRFYNPPTGDIRHYNLMRPQVHQLRAFDSDPFDVSSESTSNEKITPLENLKRSLPWLKLVLNGEIISLPAGNYKLGLNETSTSDIQCPATPNNQPGLCKLLHECSDVYNLLKTVDVFEQHRCDMRGFAAICCPKKIDTN